MQLKQLATEKAMVVNFNIFPHSGEHWSRPPHRFRDYHCLYDSFIMLTPTHSGGTRFRRAMTEFPHEGAPKSMHLEMN